MSSGRTQHAWNSRLGPRMGPRGVLFPEGPALNVGSVGVIVGNAGELPAPPHVLMMLGILPFEIHSFCFVWSVKMTTSWNICAPWILISH